MPSINRVFNTICQGLMVNEVDPLTARQLFFLLARLTALSPKQPRQFTLPLNQILPPSATEKITSTSWVIFSEYMFALRSCHSLLCVVPFP